MESTVYQTISELFSVALQLEREAQILYTKWAKAFASYPEVASFWSQYAQDEAQHARILEEVRSSLSREQLMSSTGVSSFSAIFNLLQNLKQTEARIKNLDDAYVFAQAMEHSEINSLFEFLVSRSPHLEAEIGKLNEKISTHINRLEDDFPQEYRTSDARRRVKVN
jgi:rubrerythrin